jgi:hypothetical protein
MKPRHVSALALFFSLVPFALAGSPKAATPPPKITKETRMDLIRAFQSELVYIRTPFPMGKKGLTLKDGKLTPDGEALQQLIALWGPSVKPGDQARITDIMVKDSLIRFEINGGPVRKQKWYQHITIAGGSGAVPLAPSDANANPRGSYVDLVFDHYVPELGPQQLKDLLRPVFDFHAKSAAEAYLDTVPPKAKEAIKNHQVLVGMNQEMVLYAKGRAPRKDREKDAQGNEYEEWIYGEPPEDVDFVRFIGDEVVRVETMKVDGEKMVRTQKEVDIAPQPTVAKEEQAPPRPADAPTLRRPGETMPDAIPGGPTPGPVAAPPPDPNPPQTVPN